MKIFLLIVCVVLLAVCVIFVLKNRKLAKQLAQQSEDMAELENKQALVMDKLITAITKNGELNRNERGFLAEQANALGLDAAEVLERADKALKVMSSAVDTEIVEHIRQAGHAFEAYVAQVFLNNRFLKVIDWISDHPIDNVCQVDKKTPDFQFECMVDKGRYRFFSVECKWRESFSREGKLSLSASEQQLQNYRQFQDETKGPVYLAVGVGGSQESPKDFYIVPLKAIAHRIVEENFLMRYKFNPQSLVFYDPVNGVLG